MAAGVFINEKSHCENSDTYSWTRNRIIYDNEKFKSRVQTNPGLDIIETCLLTNGCRGLYEGETGNDM